MCSDGTAVNLQRAPYLHVLGTHTPLEKNSCTTLIQAYRAGCSPPCYTGSVFLMVNMVLGEKGVLECEVRERDGCGTSNAVRVGGDGRVRICALLCKVQRS